MGRLKNMTTLKELVANQNLTGDNDIQIIKAFFTLNDMEEEGMDLIHELTKSKIAKLNHRQYIIEEWVSHLPSKYLYENYDLETADWLHRLELNYLSYGGELSDWSFKWAQENVPNIIRPECYFNPLIDWLEKHGIKFKERKV